MVALWGSGRSPSNTGMAHYSSIVRTKDNNLREHENLKKIFKVPSSQPL
jgi:hypothetical protein